MGVNQQVGRLDVAVQDPQAVGVVERLGRLDTQPGDVAAKATSWCIGPTGVGVSAG